MIRGNTRILTLAGRLCRENVVSQRSNKGWLTDHAARSQHAGNLPPIPGNDDVNRLAHVAGIQTGSDLACSPLSDHLRDSAEGVAFREENFRQDIFVANGHLDAR